MAECRRIDHVVGIILSVVSGVMSVGSPQVVHAEVNSVELPVIRVAVLPAISTRMILPMTPFREFGAKRKIVLAAARGEYEPATFVIGNASAVSQQIRLEIDELEGPSGVISRNRIDLKHVLVWYQATGAWTTWRKPRRNTDAFLTPELLVNDPDIIRVDRESQNNFLRLSKPSGPEYILISARELKKTNEYPTVREYPVYDSPNLLPVSIPAGENHQVWITVHVPSAAASGAYQGAVRILDSRGSTLATIPITLEVHDFELPPPRIEYSMYYRGKLADHHPTVSHEWKSTNQLIADLESMISQGISNPNCYKGLRHKGEAVERLRPKDEAVERLRPKDEAVEKSSPVAARDLVVKYLAIRRSLGLIDRPLYFLGRLTGRRTDSKYLALLEADTKDMLSLAHRYGASDLYIYGLEARKNQPITDQHAAWRSVKAAGAKVFAAGSRGYFESSAGLTDLLVYHGIPNREVAKKQHQVGNKIFKYGEPQAGPEDPLLWRKSFGIAVWQADYDGVMPYAFQAQFGSMWNDWDGLYYRTSSLAYPAADKPIPTLAFEGLREAVDDVRYLTALENAISRKRQASDLSRTERDVLGDAESFLRLLKMNSNFDPSGVRTKAVSYLQALGE